MLNPHTERKGLRLHHPTFTGKQFENIAGRMSGSHNYRCCRDHFAALKTYTGNAIEPGNDINNLRVEMNFTTCIQNRIPNFLNNMRKFIGANMRTCIDQDIWRGSMKSEKLQYLFHIAPFIGARI